LNGYQPPVTWTCILRLLLHLFTYLRIVLCWAGHGAIAVGTSIGVVTSVGRAVMGTTIVSPGKGTGVDRSGSVGYVLGS
jgi:hypothetical protein